METNKIPFFKCMVFPMLILSFSFAINSNAQDVEENVFSLVDNMPTYPGCESMDSEEEKRKCTGEKIMGFLSENIVYPDEAKSKGIEGKVYLSYIIDNNGSITHVQVLKGVPNGQILDDEAKRVVESLPEFNPGMQSGKAVAVRYNLPINFTLGNSTDEIEE